MFELSQVFAESCGHQSLCSIHVIKPTHPNFDHTKYEPDISSLARKKWGFKIEVDCRTPCRIISANTKEDTRISCGWLRILAPRVSPIHHGTKGFISKVHGSPLQLYHIHITLGSLGSGSLEQLMARRGEERRESSWINVPLCILAARGISLFSAACSSDSMPTHAYDARMAKSLHFRQRRVGHECLVPNWDRS